jgi:hypothetical protein
MAQAKVEAPKPRNSIAEQEETMDIPDLHGRSRRKGLEAFEQSITGGHHIGHLPVYVQAIEGWSFRRCRCGFSLALTPGGAIWWLRITKDSVEIKSFKLLLRALNSNCWAHPRPESLKNAVVSPPAVAEIAAETPTPPVSASAVSTAPRPASLETPGKSKAKDHAVPTPMPPVTPAKRRRTYVPNDPTRTTRSRPNPTGR